MTATLGLSCFYHDSAAALIVDGSIIAAAQEERFTRIKGDAAFPVNAISFCLEQGGIESADLDSVVFYDKPGLTFERLIETYVSVAPKGLMSWLAALPEWSSRKLHVEEIIRAVLRYEGVVLFSPHHLAHAASAFYPSPFDRAAILTVDGVGEWATSSYGVGRHTEIETVKEMRFPHSLGLLYSAFTYFCGFKVNSGEYKLMGLAPYGRPRFVDLLKKHVVQIHGDGTIELNQRYFGYTDSLQMTSGAMAELFGGGPRNPESRITQREMDLARSVQVVTEEAIFGMASWVHEQTGEKNLCLAGGVALNCVANGRLHREGPFDRLWIQPAAGDAGGALGAALAVQFGYHGIERPELHGARDRQSGSFLGPEFSRDEVCAALDARNAVYRVLDAPNRAAIVARALHVGKIVGFFSGRMEFGPRALGARSILGDARREDTQKIMNLKIKYRESFRPFAPSVLAECCEDYFDLDVESPYMLLVAPVRQERRFPMSDDGGEDLLFKVNQRRSDIPSVTHVDYSARVQTVHPDTNGLYYEVIKAFKAETGCAVIVNTSFNVRGEPIVCTPEDAYVCFMRTEMDALFIEGIWLEKIDQPRLVEEKDWRREFMPD